MFVPLVFLLDVDNTLLDNDRFVADLNHWLSATVGKTGRREYWSIYAERRERQGYSDYLGALQSLQDRIGGDTMLIRMSTRLLDYPFKDRLYTRSLAAIKHLRTLGTPVILSDGDVLFQPRKIQKSGLWKAVEGRVLIYPHKERQIDRIQRRFPARHYVMIDDKPQLLAAMKRQMGDRLTTVFVKQGHYASAAEGTVMDPMPDRTITTIGDLCELQRADFIGASDNQHSRNHYDSSFPGGAMKPTRQLHNLGQSLWLDTITRPLLDEGTLRRYIEEDAITGLTSNPTIFEKAISSGPAYDVGIREMARSGLDGERIFIELALEDLRRAADLFRPVFDASQHIDGWVSMEISPLLARDTKGSIRAAKTIHALANRPNLLVKIPGTPEGLAAIEESIFAGIPVNVTLLFSPKQYLAAAQAYLRGIERRLESGLDPCVGSVASIFISRWDTAVRNKVSSALHNRLGIAIGAKTYRAYCKLLTTQRWKRLAAAGAHSQRLLWASTGSKFPDAPETLYVEALAVPDTINTLPEKTLLAFADHGELDDETRLDPAETWSVLANFRKAGIDLDALALQLQDEGAQDFVVSWQTLLECIASKHQSLVSVRRNTPRVSP